VHCNVLGQDERKKQIKRYLSRQVQGSATLYVNETGSGGAYTNIQDAINASIDGDTVYVYSGTYYENVVVNRSIDLTGEDTNSTIVNGGGTGTVVYVTVDWVNITGFTITNGSYGLYIDSSSNNIILNNNVSNNEYGIELHSSLNNNITDNNFYSNNDRAIYLFLSSNNSITNNNISDNNRGIYLSSSSNNTITGNNVSSNDGYGICISWSSNNTIISNNFIDDGLFIAGWYLLHYNSHNIPTNNIVNGKPLYYYKNSKSVNIDGIPVGQIILANCTDFNIKNLQINNTDVGIEVAYSTNINITNNNISFNNWHGIYLPWASNNNITNNSILNNYDGIRFRSSSSNNITSNNVLNNGEYGIRLYSSSNNNLIRGNNVSKNGYGIRLLTSSNDNLITGNNVSSNNLYGIRLVSSTNNSIYHNNIISNVNQAYDDRSDNYWDNGYPSGGNYWFDYDGVDLNSTPNQDVPPPDGIGDTPYVIDADSQDNFPLMEPYTSITFENYTILKQGWNLISLPLIQTNQNLTKVLEMIDGYYDAVQWYDITETSTPWKHNKVGKPYGNDLFKINETMGLWIHITQPGDTIFIYNGAQPSVNQTIKLYPGWNLMGYPSLNNKNRTEGLNNLTFGSEVDAIWTYNANSQKWIEITASDYFEVGMGYWMHSKVTKTWEVPL
jgi:parallel beta-helix repeat protein